VRAKKIGLSVEFAQSDEALFVRLKEFHGSHAAARREPIPGVLRPGVSMLPPRIASVLREKRDATVDGQLVLVILEQQARTGDVLKQKGCAWIFRRKVEAV
jgi:hypothetical protein